MVLDSNGREIASQILPLSNVSWHTKNYHTKAYLGKSASNSARYWLAFSASVPPLGFSTYVVSGAKTSGRMVEFILVKRASVITKMHIFMLFFFTNLYQNPGQSSQ